MQLLSHTAGRSSCPVAGRLLFVCSLTNTSVILINFGVGGDVNGPGIVCDGVAESE